MHSREYPATGSAQRPEANEGDAHPYVIGMVAVLGVLNARRRMKEMHSKMEKSAGSTESAQRPEANEGDAPLCPARGGHFRGCVLNARRRMKEMHKALSYLRL